MANEKLIEEEIKVMVPSFKKLRQTDETVWCSKYIYLCVQKMTIIVIVKMGQSVQAAELGI